MIWNFLFSSSVFFLFFFPSFCFFKNARSLLRDDSDRREFFSKIIYISLCCIFTGFDNCTLPYELPVRVNYVYEVTDARMYAMFCIWLIPASTVLTVGATGADSLLVTLTFYLCGQLSILGNRLKNVNLEMGKHHCEMKLLIDRHAELVRWDSILLERKRTKRKKKGKEKKRER